MNNIIFDNIVINPNEEIVPFISISSLDRKNYQVSMLESTPLTDDFFKNKFGTKYIICRKGREALSIALNELNLSGSDVVTIFTTTNSSYISSCVTNTIECYCNWSRVIVPETKAILVNHEFGYVYNDLAELKKYNLPIIEDCAHAFYSQSKDIGQVGDFVIYSLPKPLSLQLGGVLVYRDRVSYEPIELLDRYVRSALEPQIQNIESYITIRKDNYSYFCNRLKGLGITPFINPHDGDVPGVFLFTFDHKVDYRKLKMFMNANGVDSSVFFGNDAYFVPVHHNLNECEKSYICTLLKYFTTQIN